jgi:hypothetical protein
VLPRDQPHPGGSLSAVVEAPGVGHGRDDRTGGDGPDAGNLGEPAALFVGPVASHDLPLQFAHLLVDVPELIQQALHEQPE